MAAAGESLSSRVPPLLSASSSSLSSHRLRWRTLESLDVSYLVVAALLSKTRTRSYHHPTSRPTTLSSSKVSSTSLSLSLLSELELKYATTPDKGGPARCRGVAPVTGDNEVAVVAPEEAHVEGSSLQPASLSP